MTSSSPWVVDLANANRLELVGGKAVNLARMIRAGLPVPGGFVVTTAACRDARSHDNSSLPDDLAGEIVAAWQRMGSPAVAVRSSATAEDMAEASMAGQYETVLDVTDESALRAAVLHCWASLDSPRTRTYSAEHGIDLDRVAMAVVVQELVASEVAGVMFTANPRTGSRDECIVEGSYGLGEAVVCGMVQPDVYTLRREDGAVLNSRIADKQVCIPPGGDGPCPVDDARRALACLTPEDLTKLWELGDKCERHFSRPQDVEWALHEGRAILLQSRAITSLEDARATQRVLEAEQARLRGLTDQGRGPWALHNLAETLPHPTPLTWSVVGRFMSGRGGFGRMHELAGFEPSQRVREEGFLQLIAGRPYMDASLAPEMVFEDYPFAYDANLLTWDPQAAQSPPTVPRGTLRARLAGAKRIAKAQRRLQTLAKDLDRRLAGEILPDFVAWCRQEKRRDLTTLTGEALAECWCERERKVMDEFGTHWLLPSLVAGMALAELEAFVIAHFWDKDARQRAQAAATGARADMTMSANADLYRTACGLQTLAEWMEAYGHRGPGEFDLAEPRWRERPDEARDLAERLTDGADPQEIHRRRQATADETLSVMRSDLSPAAQHELECHVDLVGRYLPFREDGKHYLMLGYDLLRDIALAAGEELGLGQDVFFLTSAELCEALATGQAPAELARTRRTEWDARRRLAPPRVIDADGIDSLAEPAVPPGGARLEAWAVSAGTACGPVRVVLSPQTAGDLPPGAILVCPSTDPAWTPLFVNAAALVLERGGTLSHGAVVARELGLPAVVLDGATRVLADGEEITVDGNAGAVLRAGQTNADSEVEADPTDVRIPNALRLPPPGPIARRAARLRGLGLLGWAVFLVAGLALPGEWLYWPSMTALDAVCWPVIALFGKVGGVAVLAAALAGVVMLGQRLWTDNRRLRAAKQRASELRRQANRLPRAVPRRAALLAEAAPLSMRMLGAAMTPLAVLLGPVIFMFLWFPLRVDPAAWSPPPGSEVSIAVTVDSTCKDAVRLTVDKPLQVDEFSENPRAVLPIRAMLERLHREARDGKDLSNTSPRLQELLETDRDATLVSLEAYLAQDIVPCDIVWKVQSTPRADGSFGVRVSAGDAPALSARVVLGNTRPPSPAEVLADAPGEAIRSLKIVYPPPETRPTYWVPLSLIGLGGWDLGWLGVYLVTYLPAMFVFRRLLGVA